MMQCLAHAVAPPTAACLPFQATFASRLISYLKDNKMDDAAQHVQGCLDAVGVWRAGEGIKKAFEGKGWRGKGVGWAGRHS